MGFVPFEMFPTHTSLLAFTSCPTEVGAEGRPSGTEALTSIGLPR